MERENHSSLPSNYLTIAQLQERWLKQQNQSESQHKGKNQEQNQESPKQNHQKQPHLQAVSPSNGSASKSRPQKQYVVKIRNDSETHRLTAAVETDDRRKSVTEIGEGDKTAYLDGKGEASESKKKKHRHWKIRKVNRKTNTEEREASGEGSGTKAQENEQASEKAIIESDVKENGWVKMNEVEVEDEVRVLPVEERVRVLSINSGNGKQKERLGKMNMGGFREQRKYQHSKVERGEKKMVWVRKDEIVGKI